MEADLVGEVRFCAIVCTLKVENICLVGNLLTFPGGVAGLLVGKIGRNPLGNGHL